MLYEIYLIELGCTRATFSNMGRYEMDDYPELIFKWNMTIVKCELDPYKKAQT